MLQQKLRMFRGMLRHAAQHFAAFQMAALAMLQPRIVMLRGKYLIFTDFISP